MSLWDLDTDMLTLWLRDQETVAARVAVTPPQQLAMTIVTIEEVLRGWYTQVRRARDDQQLARAYDKNCDRTVFGASITIPLPETSSAPASHAAAQPPLDAGVRRWCCSRPLLRVHPRPIRTAEVRPIQIRTAGVDVP